MDENYVGQAVSVVTHNQYQGVIKVVEENFLKIGMVCRNGIPLDDRDEIVTIRDSDIQKLDIIPFYKGPGSAIPPVVNKVSTVKQPKFPRMSTFRNSQPAVPRIPEPTQMPPMPNFDRETDDKGPAAEARAIGPDGGKISGQGRGYGDGAAGPGGQVAELVREISSLFRTSMEFVNDKGFVIPTIPIFLRTKLENIAENRGFTWPRRVDALARGVCDFVLDRLGSGGEQVRTQQVVLICDKARDKRCLHIGSNIGRLLGQHGLTVSLCLDELFADSEVSLFKSTANTSVTMSVADLPPAPALVLLTTNHATLQESVRRWINSKGVPVIAIDTPARGVRGITVDSTIVPILPLDGFWPRRSGKVYLCNTFMPDGFYQLAGIEYKSPFGMQSVMPIYPLRKKPI